MTKRIYAVDPTAPGYALPTSVVQNEFGQRQNSPVPMGLGRKPIGDLIARGNPVVGMGGSPAQGQNGNASTTANTTAASTTGGNSLATREFQANASAISYAYRISYENNSGAAVQVVMGDANTIIVQSQGIPALPGTVVVDGTWGLNSDKIWRLVTGFTPVRVTGIRINFDTSTFLTAGSLFAYKTRPDNIESPVDLQIATWISPNQFQSLIVEPPQPFDVLWDATFGLVATIPDGRSVTFTLYYTSVGDVSLQRQISAPRQF